ncbi:MAG: septum formation initiator family protein [Actinobacteria bacterium]|nr:septum formation initiator family protein [Actinomycetota bacterium]
MKAMTAGRLGPRLGIGSRIVIVVLVVGLFAALAIEPTRQLLEQRERLAAMSNDLHQVERSNERLEARIDRLKDPDFLEQRARALGLVRSGETTYIVMPPSNTRKKAQRRKAAKVQPPPEPGLLESFLQFVGVP